MYAVGQFFGGLMILGLVTQLLMRTLKRWNSDVPGILTANGLLLFIATILGGFGMADGGEPVFREAFANYVLPQLAVLGFSFWQWNRFYREVVSAVKPVIAPATASGETKFPQMKWLYAAVSLIAFAVCYVLAKEGVRYLNVSTQAEKETASNRGLQQARDNMKTTLPKKLDDATTLVDVQVEGLNMTYVNEIGAEYEVKNIDAIEALVKKQVCASSMVKSISQGISYTYEYWGPHPERKFWGRFKISSCP
ncbi:hypothetical protein [Microvirga flavescens]|uniref:hypothetical protein n=1 Tax=Microvirga flavescens TaxID=2249811 RepID=UPI000DD6039B|nr:hypothetical protein [Microvirga flavescens]